MSRLSMNTNPVVIRRRRCRLAFWAVLVCLLVLAFWGSVGFGAADLSWADIARTLFLQPPDTVAHTIVWQLRLPYALMAVVVGLMLGLAGAEMQTILNNALASPFTLGVSSAAALGASLAIILGLVWPGVSQALMVSLLAFGFALASALLLDLVARLGGMNTAGIVLFGIALVFSLNAAVALLQFVADAHDLQALIFWTMGSFARASWPVVAGLFACFIIILPWSLSQSWQLTALRLGEQRAASFGVQVSRLRLAALARISILAALAVAFAGIIGFVGLVAPHMARSLFGEDHRLYLPASALIGAVVLSLAGLASKMIMPGVVVPLSIVTSLIGVPFFMVVVLKNRGH